jgi:hypothetical protein
MSGAYQYKPRFKDIRIRPPKAGEEEAKSPDVNGLKPGEKPCEWPGCRKAATARAPKSREMMNEHYWFCQPHAGEYNKSWDFFAGMSEGELKAAQAARLTGERPTWAFKASRFSREAASLSAKADAVNKLGAGAEPGDMSDPLGVFKPATGRVVKPSRNLGRLELRALEELDLDEFAEPGLIRTRYLEMVKRFHPDSNGGDRSTEQKLTRVLKSYKVLKAAKLV